MLPQLKIPLIATYYKSRLDFFLGQYENTEKHFERRYQEMFLGVKDTLQWVFEVSREVLWQKCRAQDVFPYG